MGKKNLRAPIANWLKPCFISLALVLTSCQSLMGPSEEEAKNETILRTKKSLVISFLNKGLPGIALKEVKTALKKYPKDADFKNLMGLTQLALKNPRASFKYFKKAYAMEKRVPFALNLSSAYIEAGQNQKAISLLKRLKKHPKFSEYKHPERVHHNMGLSNERLKNTREAIRYYRRALSSNPSFYISLIRLGQIYQKKGWNKKARNQFRTAAKACPQCFDPINGLTMTYIAQGKPRKAIRILNKFLKNQKVTEGDKTRAEDMLKMARRFQRSKQSKKYR